MDDVVSLIKIVLDKGVTGIYNCGSGREISILDLARMIIELSGREVEIKHGAPRPGDIKHSRADITAARAIGFEPSTDLRRDLKRYFFRG